MPFLPSFTNNIIQDQQPLLQNFSPFANAAVLTKSYHKWSIITFLTDLFYILRLSGIFSQAGNHRWVIVICVVGQIIW